MLIFATAGWLSGAAEIDITEERGALMFRLLSVAFLIGLTIGFVPAMAQTPPRPRRAPARPARPTPPTRDPNTPGYVTAKELPDGANAPVKEDGNFILGPTHNPAPEMTVQEGVPQGTVYEFHHGIDGQQDLSRHRARAGHFARRTPTIPPS